MASKKPLVAVAALVLLVGLIASTGAPVSATHSSRVFGGTDPAGDAEFSTLCWFDDRDPDPYTGVGGTGVQAANCDNYVGETDLRDWGLEYIPAGDTRALFDPAGNDGILGTADDARGPDGKIGTGDEPCTLDNPYGASGTYPGCDTAATPLSKRVGTIQATWTYEKPWPASTHQGNFLAKGTKNDENIGGMSSLLNYRNADIQNNTLQATCDRNAGKFITWNGLQPTLAPTVAEPTKQAPAYIFDPRGAMHYEDGTYFHIWVSWEFTGPGTGSRVDQQYWRPRINFGYYSPAVDEDIHWSNTPQNNLLYNPYNRAPTGPTANDPWTGLGRFYDFKWSNENKTKTTKLPATYLVISNNCMDQGTGPNQEPYLYEPYARTADDKTGALAPRSLRTGEILNPGNGQNDVLFDIFTQSLVSVRPTLPVPIPTGSVIGAAICPTVDSLDQVQIPLVGAVPPRCPGLLRNDVDWVIGFGFGADVWNFPDGSSGFQGGLLSPSLGPAIMQGPTCNSPTFGGNLPDNPFWRKGYPCAVRNPFNIGLKHNNNHLHAF